MIGDGRDNGIIIIKGLKDKGMITVTGIKDKGTIGAKDIKDKDKITIKDIKDKGTIRIEDTNDKGSITIKDMKMKMGIRDINTLHYFPYLQKSMFPVLSKKNLQKPTENQKIKYFIIIA